MAVIPSTRALDNKKVVIYTWSGLGTSSATDTGSWEDVSFHSDKTIHVQGTFNGATIVFQGSNDPAAASPQTLNDPLGNPLSFLSGTPLKAVLENSRFVRPSISGGGASTNLSVILVAKKEF